MKYYEVNFDGQIAPTHEFAGLSKGNIASTQHQGLAANHSRAIEQWQHKVSLIASLGIKQFKLPLVTRPDANVLKTLGLTQAQLQNCPSKLKSALLSASAMWAANAATITPSCDSLDAKVHVTPANLAHFFHRLIEVEQTQKNLTRLFDSEYFIHHAPLPNHPWFYDEGSANHLRICPDYGHSAINIFVYGHDSFNQDSSEHLQFPSRQSLQASEAIARNHKLNPKDTLFVQQNPKAINAGVFHNDVISVANKNVLLFHEQAFINTQDTIKTLKNLYSSKYPASTFYPIGIKASDLSLKQAVSSYLFNSQLVSVEDKKGEYMALVAPYECKANQAVQAVLNKILNEDNPIKQIYYLDLSESMANGGGPACLRLRVVLSEAELASLKLDDYRI
ncbi:N-succinylarginine dihydrolase [Catenovulum sp. SX2]|uniref:N-succinylarginine dihydrolase n=1 Tax=Catenovulum sp. SX2 TaxID=3398614 RepID=UPI003F861030